MNEEFRKLAQPLVEYLHKHYHPHAKILIDYEYAEIVEGTLSEQFKLEQKMTSDFDWESFRNQAAKDILCSIIQSGYYGEDRIAHQSELAVEYANELCKQLKEKEEK